MRFASFLSGGFTTMAVINPPEMQLAKRTSVQWGASNVYLLVFSNWKVNIAKNPIAVMEL